MGWFWANTAVPQPTVKPASHPMPSSGATPPPGCPMHQKSPAAPVQATKPSASQSECPYVPPDTSPNSSTPQPANISTLSKLNPLNYMPANLSNQREAPSQSIALPLSRETSSIPKGDGTGANWEYPSPQQMYNAMLRKGYTDTPEDNAAIESMVAVHNFLNEGAWAEIMEWERRFGRGLRRGWETSRYGEEGSRYGAMSEEEVWREKAPAPQLIRFMGRPGEFTPKAQILQALGWAWPSKFGGEAPFDRHDWFVRRQEEDGSQSEVRYVIDYYSGEPEPTGEPVFFLDVRPAVDSPSAAAARLMRWGGDMWWRGTGGSIRAEVEKARAAAKAAEGR